ncbi:disulfide bond formation protein B [Undibacterium arcticum]|uniref:Disulfide bond formation protein B n=1 Tax=Undibacterium arcticum TaxID=1762892 RepID=A0ABV7FA94_9BURK
MKSRHLLLAVALVCIALLAAAMYMQLGLNMQPCPLCVLQRYAFVAIAIFCLIGGLGGFTKPNAGLALIGALSGVGVAGYHLYVKAHPDFSCGIDPLETSLNTIPTARLFPSLFKANGFCSTDYGPILGLSIPMWAMVWFVICSVVLVAVLRKRD